MMKTYSLMTHEFLETLDVTLDGDRLFGDYERSRFDRILCMLICGGTRLSGLALIAVAIVLAIQDDVMGAFYVAVFGLTLFFGGLVGLRQYQNEPIRITLDTDSLIYTNPITGRRRKFPRDVCLNVRCARTDGNCAVYVMHPDSHMELLIDQLPREIVPELVEALNTHLCINVEDSQEPARTA